MFTRILNQKLTPYFYILIQTKIDMSTKTNLNTLYLINDNNKKVNLEITVGDEGQTAVISVRLDKKIIQENHSGNLSNVEIGKSNELNGKVLKITAIITDTSRKNKHHLSKH